MKDRNAARASPISSNRAIARTRDADFIPQRKTDREEMGERARYNHRFSTSALISCVSSLPLSYLPPTLEILITYLLSVGVLALFFASCTYSHGGVSREALCMQAYLLEYLH